MLAMFYPISPCKAHSEMIVVIIACALLAVLLWRHMREEPNPVDKLPGPRSIPLVGNGYCMMKVAPDGFFEALHGMTLKYGDRYGIKHFGKRIVHLSNPDDIEAILSHPRNISKSLPYTFLESWLGKGLLLSTGNLWHRRRRILTPTFHFNILKNFSGVMEEKSKDLVKTLRALDGQEVSVLPVISNFTLCTICETAMGTQLDSDKSSASVEYKAAILDIGTYLLERITRIWLHNEFIFRKIHAGKKFDKTLDTVHSFADNVINEKKRKRTQGDKEHLSATLEGEDIGSKKRLAMLDLLLESESKGEIDLDGIRDEVNTFMFEGHDTTAMALTFCMMLLADHDAVQNRVFEECQAVLGDGEASLTDLNELKYLEGVVKETLRLYPSVPFIGRDITEDFQMRDLKIKKGTEVSLHIYDLHRRADLFPDPDSFDPERFLGGEARHPYAYIPFSAGPRNCIGQRFAMQEMKCVLSEICRSFRLVAPRRGSRPRLAADMVLRPADPVLLKFIPRKK